MKSLNLKKWGLIALLIIAALTAAIMMWSNMSIKANPQKPDPAVVLANEIGSEGINYIEGYVGESGRRIHYITAGKGEPIIFAHGFPSYWFTMFTLMEEFKSDYQVIAFDGLGTGLSDAPGAVNAYDLESITASISLIVKELGLGKVHLVGHDWGVTLVTGYARANPEKVKTVTTMAALPHNIIMARLQHDASHREMFSYTSYFARANPLLVWLLGIKDTVWETSYASLHEKGLISDRHAARLRADIGNPRRFNRFIHWYRANLTDFENITDDIFWPDRSVRLTVPSLLIYGDEDIVLTEQLIDDFKDHCDALDVVKLEGVGHRPHFERRDEVVSEIKKLIAASEPAAQTTE